MFPNFPLGPIPPSDLQERSRRIFIKPMPEDAHRIACHNGIGRHIFCNNCSCLYHSPIADTDAAHNNCARADAYIISDDDLIPFADGNKL